MSQTIYASKEKNKEKESSKLRRQQSLQKLMFAMNKINSRIEKSNQLITNITIKQTELFSKIPKDLGVQDVRAPNLKVLESTIQALSMKAPIPPDSRNQIIKSAQAIGKTFISSPLELRPSDVQLYQRRAEQIVADQKAFRQKVWGYAKLTAGIGLAAGTIYFGPAAIQLLGPSIGMAPATVSSIVSFLSDTGGKVKLCFTIYRVASAKNSTSAIVQEFASLGTGALISSSMGMIGITPPAGFLGAVVMKVVGQGVGSSIVSQLQEIGLIVPEDGKEALQNEIISSVAETMADLEIRKMRMKSGIKEGTLRSHFLKFRVAITRITLMKALTTAMIGLSLPFIYTHFDFLKNMAGAFLPNLDKKVLYSIVAPLITTIIGKKLEIQRRVMEKVNFFINRFNITKSIANAKILSFLPQIYGLRALREITFNHIMTVVFGAVISIAQEKTIMYGLENTEALANLAYNTKMEDLTQLASVAQQTFLDGVQSGVNHLNNIPDYIKNVNLGMGYSENILKDATASFSFLGFNPAADVSSLFVTKEPEIAPIHNPNVMEIPLNVMTESVPISADPLENLSIPQTEIKFADPSFKPIVLNPPNELNVEPVEVKEVKLNVDPSQMMDDMTDRLSSMNKVMNQLPPEYRSAKLNNIINGQSAIRDSLHLAIQENDRNSINNIAGYNGFKLEKDTADFNKELQSGVDRYNQDEQLKFEAKLNAKIKSQTTANLDVLSNDIREIRQKLEGIPPRFTERATSVLNKFQYMKSDTQSMLDKLKFEKLEGVNAEFAEDLDNLRSEFNNEYKDSMREWQTFQENSVKFENAKVEAVNFLNNQRAEYDTAKSMIESIPVQFRSQATINALNNYDQTLKTMESLVNRNLEAEYNEQGLKDLNSIKGDGFNLANANANIQSSYKSDNQKYQDHLAYVKENTRLQSNIDNILSNSPLKLDSSLELSRLSNDQLKSLESSLSTITQRTVEIDQLRKDYAFMKSKNEVIPPEFQKADQLLSSTLNSASLKQLESNLNSLSAQKSKLQSQFDGWKQQSLSLDDKLSRFGVKEVGRSIEDKTKILKVLENSISKIDSYKSQHAKLQTSFNKQQNQMNDLSTINTLLANKVSSEKANQLANNRMMALDTVINNRNNLNTLASDIESAEYDVQSLVDKINTGKLDIGKLDRYEIDDQAMKNSISSIESASTKFDSLLDQSRSEYIQSINKGNELSTEQISAEATAKTINILNSFKHALKEEQLQAIGLDKPIDQIMNDPDALAKLHDFYNNRILSQIEDTGMRQRLADSFENGKPWRQEALATSIGTGTVSAGIGFFGGGWIAKGVLSGLSYGTKLFVQHGSDGEVGGFQLNDKMTRLFATVDQALLANAPSYDIKNVVANAVFDAGSNINLLFDNSYGSAFSYMKFIGKSGKGVLEQVILGDGDLYKTYKGM